MFLLVSVQVKQLLVIHNFNFLDSFSFSLCANSYLPHFSTQMYIVTVNCLNQMGRVKRIWY